MMDLKITQLDASTVSSRILGSPLTERHRPRRLRPEGARAIALPRLDPFRLHQRQPCTHLPRSHWRCLTARWGLDQVRPAEGVPYHYRVALSVAPQGQDVKLPCF